jgi:hypothetical protein
VLAKTSAEEPALVFFSKLILMTNIRIECECSRGEEELFRKLLLGVVVVVAGGRVFMH